MPTIAFDTSPLESDHKGRGVGTYTRELIKALKQIESPFEFIFSSDVTQPQVDLIHYPYFDFFFPTLPVFKKSKTIVTIHDVIPLCYPEKFPPGLKGKVSLIKQRLALQSTSGVITDSLASLEDINLILNYPKHKIHPIPLAASEVFHPATSQEKSALIKKYQLPERFLLFVGGVSYNKNLPFLITTISQQSDIPLIINTQTDIYSQETELQTRMVLDPIVTALKTVSDQQVKLVKMDSVGELNTLYSTALAYIQPSLKEGFGLPILEAFQAGTVVLSANTSSLPEVGGNAAIYFDPLSANSLEKAIKRVSKLTPKDRLKQIHKGFSQANQFSWQKTAVETIKAYQSVLKV